MADAMIEAAVCSLGCFAAFDDLLAVTVKTLDRDKCYGPLLPNGAVKTRASVTLISERV